MSRKAVNVGIIGYGTVGTGTARILLKNRKEIERRIGFPIVLKRIADLDIRRNRGLKLPKGMLVRDSSKVINDPDIDIVIELIGGIHPAKEFIFDAIKSGKNVVTANKALLATDGRVLFNAAKKNKVVLGYEAAIAGGIPIIKVIRESMAGDRVKSILGIINGTANYILTKMTDEGVDFASALNEAKALGYAEADPTFDIEGIDSAHKLAILASLCYGLPFSFKKVYTEGITGIKPIDIDFATEFGYKIKLLAIAKLSGKEVEVRVHPTMLPSDYLISNVNGVLNAVFVESEASGPALYYGSGAGEMPTGNAVVSDVIDIAREMRNCASQKISGLGMPEKSDVTVMKMDEVTTSYYLRLTAVDKPGVLSKISGILGKHNISIKSMIQKGREKKGVPLVMMTHKAREKDMVKALKEINRLSCVVEKTMLIRVEGEDE